MSYSIASAILTMSYIDSSRAFLPVALIMLVFGAIRLCYFSTPDLSDDAKYTGLVIDNSSVILVLIFMFRRYLF